MVYLISSGKVHINFADTQEPYSIRWNLWILRISRWGNKKSSQIFAIFVSLTNDG